MFFNSVVIKHTEGQIEYDKDIVKEIGNFLFPAEEKDEIHHLEIEEDYADRNDITFYANVLEQDEYPVLNEFEKYCKEHNFKICICGSTKIYQKGKIRILLDIPADKDYDYWED